METKYNGPTEAKKPETTQPVVRQGFDQSLNTNGEPQVPAPAIRSANNMAAEINAGGNPDGRVDARDKQSEGLSRTKQVGLAASALVAGAAIASKFSSDKNEKSHEKRSGRH